MRIENVILYSSWLLLTACSSTPREAPAKATPAAAPWFEEVAKASGIDWTHRSGHRDRFLLPEIMGGGAALLDIDNDGNLDIYLVQSGSVTDPSAKDPGNRLFRNNGEGVFEDVTKGSGADVPGYGMGAAVGDYDNDGDADLYVTNLGSNVLLQSDGRGHFTDVTRTAGVASSGWSTSAAFLDIEPDGDLDLFVLRYIDWSIATEVQCFSLTGLPDYCSPRNYDAPMSSVLYRNNGNGTFTDVSEVAGLQRAVGNGLGLVASDFNRDGQIDVFVANDAMPHQLWINQGRQRFADHALIAGAAVDQDGSPKSGMGIDARDLDDDGDADVLVANLDSEADSFFRNQGDYFVDDTASIGLRLVSRPFTRFGLAFVDFDNDGILDLYQANGRVGQQSEKYSDDPFAEPSLLFRGQPDGRFEEVTPRGGTATLLVASSRAAAFGDLNNDGGIDIVIVNRDAAPSVLKNVVSSRGQWIEFRVLDEKGRDAFGAEVSFSLGARRITREVRAAYSYLASNDPRVHVGLGAQTRAINVSVRWPDGQTEAFGDVPANQIVTVRRRSGVTTK